MKKRFPGAGALPVFIVWIAGSAFHLNVYEPRVPQEILELVQENENPFPATPERIEEGRRIFYGKGLCVTCHGKDGKGIDKIPGHAPRDFTDARWQELRTDGELMWVLRNGSPGTSMPVRVGKVLSEEEGWSVIHFLRTFAGK
ncbi:MAG: cytochrome c [Nitrospinaceae bacterium]|jgi:mono/diheme cytochrome c family protein|nr:MAG: cytochrome c [Nitrospinaceae bacterium]